MFEYSLMLSNNEEIILILCLRTLRNCWKLYFHYVVVSYLYFEKDENEWDWQTPINMQTAMNYIILILQRSVYVVTRSGTERGCREGLFYLGWIKFLEGRTWAPCASRLYNYFHIIIQLISMARSGHIYWIKLVLT